MVKRDKQARSAVNPENKKVKNATPVEADGIHFRSKLELYCYNILKSHQILSEYEQKTFTLLDSFEYQGEKIRPMTYKPDFTGDK
jgi:hypothetical protein